MPAVFTAMMPHAPIIIPEVGGDRAAEVRSTWEACNTIGKRLKEKNPDLVVLISPHTPIISKNCIPYRCADRFRLSFIRFGCGDIDEILPSLKKEDPSLFSELTAKTGRSTAIDDTFLDHGAGVPLYFLCKNDLDKPLYILGPDFWSRQNSLKTAAGMAEVLADRGTRYAVIASADMSHALQEGAPGGFNPRAHEYDEEFVDIIKRQNYNELPTIDEELQELARQDSMESTLMALQMSGFSDKGGEFLAYEGPFGVGYLSAVLNSE